MLFSEESVVRKTDVTEQASPEEPFVVDLYVCDVQLSFCASN